MSKDQASEKNNFKTFLHRLLFCECRYQETRTHTFCWFIFLLIRYEKEKNISITLFSLVIYSTTLRQIMAHQTIPLQYCSCKKKMQKQKHRHVNADTSEYFILQEGLLLRFEGKARYGNRFHQWPSHNSMMLSWLPITFEGYLLTSSYMYCYCGRRS